MGSFYRSSLNFVLTLLDNDITCIQAIGGIQLIHGLLPFVRIVFQDVLLILFFAFKEDAMCSTQQLSSANNNENERSSSKRGSFICYLHEAMHTE